MREILFRGKRKDNGEWVEGIPMRTNSTEIGIGKKITFMNVVPWTDKRKGKILAYFDSKNCPAIDDNTICQYTGLTDKNGTKIFAGDIVKTKYGRLCEVRWFSSPCSQCWDLIPIENKHKIPDEYDLWIPKNLEVIGNIHDNFELLNK